MSTTEDECVALFNGLVVPEGTEVTDTELFNDTLIGDMREDSYAEVLITENEVKIKWAPNAIEGKSFYSPADWIFEETQANGKTYKK